LASIFELLTWLNFNLSVIFTVGLPIALHIWSINNKNKVIKKLLLNYWKISILFIISLMLFIGEQTFSLLILNISFVLMTISVWFWTDINDELREYKIFHPLTLTTKVWRWSLTFISISFLFLSCFNNFCIFSLKSADCAYWFEPSNNLYSTLKILFNFLFGATFTAPIAKFLGLFALLIYSLGLLQWLIIELPKSGRKSNFSDYESF